MSDYALVWNDHMQWYDIYAMSDAKTRLHRLGCISAEDIHIDDINDKIAGDYRVEGAGTG